jgi:hypothetical protein
MYHIGTIKPILLGARRKKARGRGSKITLKSHILPTDRYFKTFFG